MDKLEQKKRIRKAWQKCEFCSQSDYDIYQMILNKEKWDEIPLTNKCAWSRICQVAFRKSIKSDEIWKDLCGERASRNHRQYSDHSTSWLEGFCETYKEVNKDE